ncbi:hypothetical protein vBVpaS1601_15 [Vibrio phage vB_VpaS_1601]|uniref:major head protein n=1 Tax=Vibrio phage SHOU24 TaxID=1414739 RepID=UPI0003ED1F72|nr:major head protein [Vibrio phage SHOU24]AHI61268.1 hypothetical protein SHOU24_71 [Vibrio phage SHOU24]WHM52708.1 hypothetical protein vBVpaP1601_15 [Vibrio phage vB_VpaP_1601]
MSEQNNVKVRFMQQGANGQAQMKEAELNLSDYKAAAKSGISLRQHVNAKLSKEGADHTYGQPFDQVCQSVGIYPKADASRGIVSPSMAQVFAGMAPGAMGLDATSNGPGSIVAPGGNDGSVAGRMFYPEILMDRIRSSLQRDNSDVEQGFNSMIAVNESIAGAHYIQPIINVTGPEDSKSMPIGQDDEPQVMLSITASDTSRRIATKSIGIRITDEAAQYASLDLVATAVEAQTRGERIRMVEGDIKAIIMGDKDNGMTALTAKNISSFDSSAGGGNGVTQKAFLKILHSEYQKRSLNAAIMGLDTYLKYQERSGRPVVTQDDGTDGRLNTQMRPVNFMLGNVPVLLIDDAIVGADMSLFLDTRFALRKVVNVFASYEAVERFVLRRAQALRMDYGQHVTRLYDEAFELVNVGA